MNLRLQTIETLTLSLLIALLSGCMSIDIETNFAPDASIHEQIINQTEDFFPEIEPLVISDEIRAMVDGYVTRFDTDVEKVRKLQDILYSEEFLHIQYNDEKTYTAIETFYEREGNCLGVMNLYIGMARYLGLDASFQTVRVQPSWDLRGDLLVLSEHINATGRFSPARYYVVDFTPEIALQQLTSRVIDDQDGRALFFNNLGAEALLRGDLDTALAYFKNALFLNPDLAIAWNNMGTVYSRSGDSDFAEYSYKMAFESDNRSVTAINNLAKFYARQGDDITANLYMRAIAQFNDRNPYYHYAQGALALAESDLLTARRAFERALRLKREEPDFYLALAQVHIRLGDIEEAERLNNSAEQLVMQNAEIYRPSEDRVRIINKDSVMRDYMPGISIMVN